MSSLAADLRQENQLRVRLGEGEPGLMTLLGGMGDAGNGFGLPGDSMGSRSTVARASQISRGGGGGSGTGAAGGGGGRFPSGAGHERFEATNP